MKELKKLINLIEMSDNLKETLNKGYNIIFESYADVRPTYNNNISYLELMQQRVAMDNKIMNFLMNSKKHLDNIYTEFSDDGNDELDNRKTSDFNQYFKLTYKKSGDVLEDSLGLNAADIHVRMKNLKKRINNGDTNV